LLYLPKLRRSLKKKIVQFLKIAEKYNLCSKQSKYNLDAKEIPNLEVVVG